MLWYRILNVECRIRENPPEGGFSLESLYLLNIPFSIFHILPVWGIIFIYDLYPISRESFFRDKFPFVFLFQLFFLLGPYRLWIYFLGCLDKICAGKVEVRYEMGNA